MPFHTFVMRSSHACIYTFMCRLLHHAVQPLCSYPPILPGMIAKSLDLMRGGKQRYQKTAAYGHFGRDDAGRCMSWQCLAGWLTEMMQMLRASWLACWPGWFEQLYKGLCLCTSSFGTWDFLHNPSVPNVCMCSCCSVSTRTVTCVTLNPSLNHAQPYIMFTLRAVTAWLSLFWHPAHSLQTSPGRQSGHWRLPESSGHVFVGAH